MDRFFDSLTADQLTDVEDPPGFGKVAKVAWGGRERSSVSNKDHRDFDAHNPPCTSSDDERDTNSELDEDFSDDEMDSPRDTAGRKLRKAIDGAAVSGAEHQRLGAALMCARTAFSRSDHEGVRQSLKAATSSYCQIHGG
jgi:hypothetical protein